MNKLGLILFAVFISACSFDKVGITLEDEVYEFVFNEIMQDASKEMVISDRHEYGIVVTETAASLKERYEELRTLPENLLNELLSNSEKQDVITWQPIMVNVNFIDASSKQPESNNYHYISNVALNNKSKEAVLLVGYSCPALCGAHDTILYLRKKGVTWEIVKGVRLWVS